MTIALVNATSASGTTANVSIALPSGSGGLLVLVCDETNGGEAPTGFTQLYSTGCCAGQITQSFYYRVADGTEANPLVSPYGGNSSGWAGVAERWSGVNTTTPIDTSLFTASSTSHASPLSVTAAQITTATAGAMLLFHGTTGGYSALGSVAFGTPSGFTSAAQPTPGGNGNIIAAYKTQASAGATGSVTSTATYTGTAQGFGAGLVALKAAAGDVTVGLTGQSGTFAQGSVTVASTGTSVALTGQATTSGNGSLMSAFTVTPTGQKATWANGAVKASPSLVLTGRSAATGAGQPSPSAQVAATGQSATTGIGTVSVASGGVTVALSGLGMASGSGLTTGASVVTLTGVAAANTGGTTQPALSAALTGEGLASAQGNVAPGLAPGMTGQAVTTSTGTVSPGGELTIALSGQSMSALIGTVSPAFTMPVTGQDASYIQGNLTATAGHNVSVGLTGNAIAAAQGYLTGDISPELIGETLQTAAGVMGPASHVVAQGKQAIFVAGSLMAAGKLIVDPGRTAVLPSETRMAVLSAETRTAILPPEQRIARLTA